ncbi:hypothetical protein [Streptomyces muensis]|uniref:Uncharacterized protein n=1 Tax=Streptomyces muensis TaxID=1077944 RepID=A0A9X1TNI8_STRM4|nr:hypothetical protein [Streptomyces muensis]MCF1597717.1 hypothetical protein [Streptomyces muensis]
MTNSDAYEIDWNDGNQEIAESVMWAADERKPLLVTTHKGEIVRLVPEAAPETESETPAAREGVVAHPIVEERNRSLQVTGAPNVTDFFGVTLAPQSVYLKYRRPTGEEPMLEMAYVNGYRVPGTNKPEEYTTITFIPGTHDLPAWLAALVDAHMPW